MADPTITDPTMTADTGDVIRCQNCGGQTRSISRGCSTCGYGTDRLATTDAVDALIAEHAAKLQTIYDRQTAGDYTFTGVLAAFAYAFAPLLARQSAGHVVEVQTGDDGYSLVVCEVCGPVFGRLDNETAAQVAAEQHRTHSARLARQSADRDTETAALRAALDKVRAEHEHTYLDEYYHRTEESKAKWARCGTCGNLPNGTLHCPTLAAASLGGEQGE